jgi:hypothetical protein
MHICFILLAKAISNTAFAFMWKILDIPMKCFIMV